MQDAHCHFQTDSTKFRLPSNWIGPNQPLGHASSTHYCPVKYFILSKRASYQTAAKFGAWVPNALHDVLVCVSIDIVLAPRLTIYLIGHSVWVGTKWHECYQLFLKCTANGPKKAMNCRQLSHRNQRFKAQQNAPSGDQFMHGNPMPYHVYLIHEVDDKIRFEPITAITVWTGTKHDCMRRCDAMNLIYIPVALPAPFAHWFIFFETNKIKTNHT